jgi:hypothetical protein
MYKRLHVKYPLFFSDFNETWIFLGRFSKNYSNFKFHKNPYIGSRIVSWGGTERQTDMTKLIAAFRSFANAPKNAPILFQNIGTDLNPLFIFAYK